jgi:hypothetical protein
MSLLPPVVTLLTRRKHSIRNAYFTYAYLLSRSHNDTSSSDSIISQVVDPFVPNLYLEEKLASVAYGDSLKGMHMGHCFDYLRQALMCAADSNLEDNTVVNGTRGTTGMGSKRVCRNFDALKDWSEKWRSTDSDGAV